MKPESSAAQANPRRILISGGLAVGGIQTHVTNLCRVLVEAGAEVTVASASTNWTARELADLRRLGVTVQVSPFGVGRFRLLGKVMALALWPWTLRRDFNVLYCIGEGKMHLWMTRFVARGGWKIYHEIVETPRKDSVPAKVAAAMDAVIANSRVVGQGMSTLLGGVPVRTIPFLTSSIPVEPPAQRHRLPGRTLRIAYLGRLAPHKRPDLLIEAWTKWGAHGPVGPARLDIYGGDYEDQGKLLRARIAELGLQESVFLRGLYTTHDLPGIFAETDIVALPSRYEGLPLVLVEAMQRGIPVVATSAGGTAELGEDNPDVIISEGTGWSQFAAGMESLAQRVRAGEIDSLRLHEWTESRYGCAIVAKTWLQALLHPEAFFSTTHAPAEPALR